jgi:DNA-binding NtrC family response regulator
MLSRSSFLIGGEPGVGQSLLARVLVRLHGDAMASRTIDGGDPKAEEMIAQVAADAPTAWVVPHIERLARPSQSELVRLVRRTPGSMLIATIGGTVEDAQAEGWLGSSVLSLVETRRVEVPNLEERREDIPALALALCNHDGIDSSNVTLDVLEHVARGGWPGGVQELRILLRVVFDRESQSPLGLPYLRRRITRPSAKIPLPLQAADADLARARLRRALDRASGTVALAARDLKMSRQSFYRELRRLGMSGGKRPATDERTTQRAV